MSKLGRSPMYAVAVVTTVACARLAGIEDPDPATQALAPEGGSPTVDGALTPPTDEGFTVKPDSVAITTSCTGGGTPQFLTLENPNATELAYELQVPEGSAFALRDSNDAGGLSLKGTIPAKGVVLAYVQVTSTKAGTFNGVIIARVGDHMKQVPVTVTVTGGALAISPTLVDFGEVRQNTTAPAQTVEIQNTGTEPVNVTGFGGVGGAAPSADFDVTTGGSINLPPGQKANATVTFVAGSAGPPITATAEPRTQIPTCGALPTLTLKGTRVNQDVTVNPVLLAFGDVPCGSSGGATKTVTITNYGSSPVSFSTTTSANSWFTVSPSSGTAPGKSGNTPGSTTVTVTLKPVGAVVGTHTDTIDVDVAGPEPKKTTITATVKSMGALLDIQPLALQGFGGDGIESFSVTNVGNTFIYVKHQSQNGSFTVDPKTEESALYPDFPFPLSVNVKFTPPNNGQFAADITTTRLDTPLISPFPNSGPLCVPAPVVRASAAKQ